MNKEKQKGNGSAHAGAGTATQTPARAEGRQETPVRREAPTPARWPRDPFAVAHRFAEEMERVFEDFGFGRGLSIPRALGERWWPATGGQGMEPSAWSPQVEVFERDNRFVIRADLPGLTKNDVQVEVAEGTVTIRGERRQEQEERREGYYHTERSYGTFYRSIPLPEGIEAEGAEANFHDGVLEITMAAPKHEVCQARRIEVKG